MPKLPRPLAAPTIALALIVAGAPLLLIPPAAVSAAVVAPYVSAGREPLAPGVDHDWGQISTSIGSQAVNLVEVDQSNPSIVFEESLSNERVTGLERVSSQAINRSHEAHRVIAAINGDVWAGFSNDAESAPNGLDVEAGELVTSGTAGRPTFGVGADGRPILGSPLVTTTLATATLGQFVINRVNQLRRPAELVVYTPHFGPRTSSAASGVDVVITGMALPIRTSGTWTGIVQQTRIADGGGPIDPGSVIVTVPSTSLLVNVQPGEQVTLTTTVTPGWEAVQQAVGGREWIVRDGAPSISPHPASADEIHPRSAVGLTADGRLILATVDGRETGVSEGVRLSDLAELMMERGAVQAINLDGGGSSTLVVRRAGTDTPVIVNKPSDGAERPVTNSIQVVSTMPTGPITVLNVQPGAGSVYKNSTIDFKATGMDAGFNPVPLPEGQVGWSLDAPVGTIDADGHFVAMTPGTGRAMATVAGVTGTVPITVLADSSPPLTKAPRASLPTSRSIGSGVPVTIAWDAASDEGSGVASYQLQRSIDGRAWTTIATPSSLTRSVILALPRDRTYRFQVRAIDRAGNVGAWSSSGAFRVTVTQESSRTVVYVKGPWSKRTSSSFDHGAARSAATSTAIARFAFTGTSLAWVGARGPTRGAARVYLDKVFAGTIDTHQSAITTRVLVWAKTWSSSGRHTIEIRSVGSGGHPRIDLDGFAMLSPVAGATPPPAAPTPTPMPTPTPTPIPTPTPTPAASGAVLVGAGDIASCGLTADTATAKLVAGIAGTVFAAGDEAYESGSAAEFQDCYDPTWGTFFNRTNPVPGNHEYVTPGAAGYFGYFGSRAGPSGHGWYAYDLGAWRIYALNSNCAVVGCDVGSTQEQWLRADLAANPRACVLAYWHHPRFSSGQHGNDSEVAPLWDDLYAAGAEVIVNGHDHDYERFAPQAPGGKADSVTGIREFVVGTGGASLRSFSTIRANSQVRNSTTHGVIKFTLGSAGYSWQFIRIAGQTFKDSGSGTCH
ncbi:MAG: phosphodiester glycosidase family protein [Candidatus Limnocylindrales bacterium]